MKQLILTLIVATGMIVSASAQRGGSTYHNNPNYNNNSGQQQFSSMISLNNGRNNNNLRPNNNVTTTARGGGHHHNDHHHNNGHHGHNGHHHGHNHPGSNTTVQVTHHHHHHHNHHHNNSYGHTCTNGASCSFGCTHNHYIHQPVCMSSFRSWLTSLSYQRNMAVRFDMALSYVTNHWLTTHQLYDILGLFCNESTKLRIAEEAYVHACDPQNYHMLYGCFSNSACVLHLQNFVVGR